MYALLKVYMQQNSQLVTIDLLSQQLTNLAMNYVLQLRI